MAGAVEPYDRAGTPDEERGNEVRMPAGDGGGDGLGVFPSDRVAYYATPTVGAAYHATRSLLTSEDTMGTSPHRILTVNKPQSTFEFSFIT